jgi:hypothetical protein
LLMKRHSESSTVEPGGFLGRRDFLKLLLGGTAYSAALGLPGLTRVRGRKTNMFTMLSLSAAV